MILARLQVGEAIMPAGIGDGGYGNSLSLLHDFEHDSLAWQAGFVGLLVAIAVDVVKHDPADSQAVVRATRGRDTALDRGPGLDKCDRRERAVQVVSSGQTGSRVVARRHAQEGDNQGTGGQGGAAGS